MPTNFVHERGTRTAHRVATRLSVDDPADVRTLRDAYLVTYEFPAPLMVRVADDMLADLREDVAARNVDRVVALGRDGHHLALAMSRLDGQFFHRHGSNVVLSRLLVENALQDLGVAGRGLPGDRVRRTVCVPRRVAGRPASRK